MQPLLAPPVKRNVFLRHYELQVFLRLLKPLKKEMTKYTTKYLEEKLTENLQATYVKAVDESDGCGGKFSVIVVAEAFKNKTLLQKHRLVNTALAEELKEIHAFSQKSYTPEEWEKVQQQQ